MVKIRGMQREDCRAVYEIAKENLPEYWSLESTQDILKYDNNFYFVACEQESEMIVGFAGIMIIADEAELLNIVVCTKFRNLGIGKQLLEQVKQVATDNGAYRMLLEVREGNSTARQLYKQLSFADLGVRKDYYSNPKENAIIMETLLRT